MNTRYKKQQILIIKYWVIGVLVCLLAVGVCGCKKEKDSVRQDIEEDLSIWAGTYTYGATFSHTIEAEFNNFIGYTVAVYEENGEYYANITANGWQICSESLAHVVGNKDTIVFLFVETLPKDSRYGKSERYEKDEIMLSFTRKEEQIETIWGTLRKEHPVFIESEEEIVGDYFVKATDNVLMETYITSESKVEAVSGPLPTLAPTYKPTPVKGSPTPKPTPTLEPTPTPTPKPKGDFPERSYESCREFPYETMEFVDESTYVYIKEAYDSFTFDGEFRSGDIALYEKYMKKYKGLVNCDISFKVQQTGENAYLKEYGEFSVSKKGAFTPEKLDYYVFDVNGDNTPELCVRTPGHSTYVFKYDETEDQITLILEMYYYEHFLGTGILYWNNFGLAGRDLNSVYHIDENGEVTTGVYFSEEAPNGEVTYLVSIPEYKNEDRATEIKQDMKAKAYYSEEDELYLFKVAESQYDQLTAAYTESWMRADKEIETVAYTYDELFGTKIEGDTSVKKERQKSVPENAKNTIEFLFDTLYADKTDIENLQVNTEEDKLYYKWQKKYIDGEMSDPYVLFFERETEDGLYHIYFLYYYVMETHYSGGEETKVHIRNESLNYWLINTQTLEVIPRWIYNLDTDTRLDNEEYLEIIRSYAMESENIWEWVIEPGEYSNIKLLKDDLICVQDKDGKYSILNVNQKQLIECECTSILGIGDEIIRTVDKTGQYVFIDLEGNTLFEEGFQDAYDFSNGIAAVKQNEQWFFIDKSGEKIFKENYEGAHGFSEGYAAVCQNGKWGFIDTRGRRIIDFQYDAVGNFGDEMVAVRKEFDGDDKWAYIDMNNEIVLDYASYDITEGRVETVGEFQNGYAVVTKGGYCLMNKGGEIVLGEDSYFLTGGSNINPSNGLIIAYDYTGQDMRQKKYGLINIKGEVKVPFSFSHISDFKGNLATVLYEKDGKEQVGLIRVYNNDVSLERMDYSIVNDNGEKVGLIYYDKVVVKEDIEGAEKINSYFEKELEEWCDSSKNEHMDRFIGQTELMLERYDEETLVEYPTNYSVTTQIMRLDTNIVSVLQIIHYSTGTSNWKYKGYTFDLQTGERLPIHTVVEIDADTLGQVIIEGVGTYPGDGMDMYTEMKDQNYTVEYWGKVIDMQYEYFIDDQFVYVILNEGIFPNDGVIMKWNGELGEKCETTLMNYVVDNNGEIVKNIH